MDPNAIGLGPSPDGFLAGDSEMAARIRQHDWRATPLGPPSAWPQSLRSAVGILLPSRAQICLFWGRELLTIYNDAYRPTLGVKHPWALGRPAREVWSEIWEGVLRELLVDVLDTGRAFWASDHPFALERHGYPEETYYDVSYDPLRDESGGIGGVFCIVSETTGRVVGERRLRMLRDLGAVASEARTSEEALHEAARVLASDPHDIAFAVLFDASERWGRGVGSGGTAPTSPESWPLDDALKAERSLAGADLARLGPLSGGAWPEPSREVLVLPIGIAGHAPVGVLVAGASPRRPIDDGFRAFIRLVASHIAEAVGAARALEQERARARALAEIDRAKSVFFSNVSHEFRTPLTLMLAPLENLLTDASDVDPEGRRALVLAAYRNGRRLLKLVNALLDFSRIEAGRMQLAMEPVELATYTAELASAFRSAMEQVGLDFRVDCSDLGAPVYVDRDAWEKIVLNLLSNAFKHTLAGSIRVGLRAESGQAVLTVADTGTGIPEHELSRIFERFHRVQGARSRTHEGSGIGLALVQELVRLHGGELAVESREGEGSTFSVRIPLGTQHVPAEALADRPRASHGQRAGAAVLVHEGGRAPAAAHSRGAGERSLILEEAESWILDESATLRAVPTAGLGISGEVLLADDNADMRSYVRRLLEEDGYSVRAVADGAEALIALEGRPPDILLTDVMMPVMDGFALLREVRAREHLNDVAVVLLSARAGEDSKVAGLESGADDYLVKPFSALELKARVRANILVSRLRRATREREHVLRLEAEAERDRLRAVLAGIRDHFLVLDDRWRYVFVSDSWCALTGIVRERVLGASVWSFFPDLAGTEWEHVARRVMETRESHSFEYRSEPDGMWWDLRMAPWPHGGLSQLSIDITARKAAELERAQLLDSERAARAEAERATRVKDEFLATLSHELRTPLNAIFGWTHLLAQAVSDPEKVRQAAAVIERNARSQAQMIADLLDMNRIQMGKLRLDVRRVDLPAVVRAAVESFAPTADAKGVRLQTSIEPVTDRIHGDAARLQQIVWNLLSNAIKFTPRGGHVQLLLTRVDSHVEITVRDTGQGISPEFVPHLFERFRQAESGAARSHTGLGLGLALVKQLAEMHGGRVRAHSEGEDLGATFVVELPLAGLEGERPSSRARSHAPARGIGIPGLPDLEGLRVLLVEDDDDAREMLSRLLAERHVEVVPVACAASAAERLQRESFDAILSDIGMPERDGCQFIAGVRRAGDLTPAIALTAFSRSQDRARALLSGFQAYLTKPIDAAELFAALAAIVGRTAPPADRDG